MKAPILFGLLCATLGVTGATAQDPAAPAIDPALYEAMQWRNVGPHRGGRVVAVAGVADQPHLYYMGATGGGVWKTENAGASWANISDGSFATGSIGAIAVAPSDANVIYVGTGEGPIRGVTTTHGDGVYRSTDAGKTWTNVGLAATRQIAAIVVDPEDSQVVLVAAQGNPWGPSHERGVYRSLDGGATWEHALSVGDTTGATDLVMDPGNPRILIASMWDHQRKPWQVRSGGPGGGLHRSTDGGATWEKLAGGLPDVVGKCGVAISPARPSRVWAIVEAEDGGLYRSDDGGTSWRRVNDRRALRARAWYYMHVFADPQDENTVYVLNGPALKSIDGGETLEPFRTPHGDNHAMWINPGNSQWMVEGNDGGANVSLDGGRTWSTQYNQPTAQFYRVITDNRFPYHLYAGQQDNTTVAIASRSPGMGIGRADWYPIGGGESAHVAFDPDDPRLVYATSIVGFVTEYDHATRVERNIQVYPEFPLGFNAAEARHRFNWNPPLIVSPHDPGVIYYGAEVLFRSRDRGRSWEAVSPDLTRDDPAKHGPGGVPFTDEAAGAEYYNTIFSIVESPHEAGTIWVGSDCGLVHLTRDGGEAWADVTPPDLGETQINAIEVSPHEPGTAWLAVTGYKLNDFAPHVYVTRDYGASWEQRVEGLPADTFVRAVREDPVRPGLLFAGTEAGPYVSFDDGDAWQPLRLNLPPVPITDLRVHGDDLVAATQGRAFWILDGIGPLRQMRPELADVAHHLFTPDAAYRLARGGEFSPQPGQNPPDGVVLYAWFGEAPDPEATEVRLEIRDAAGDLVRTYANRRTDASRCYEDNAEFHGPDDAPYGLIELKTGMNRLEWNLRHENVECVPGHYALGWDGPRVAPGRYTARLMVDDASQEVTVEVRGDPRLGLDASEMAEAQRLVLTAYEGVDILHGEVNLATSVRDQIEHVADLTRDTTAGPVIRAAGAPLIEALTAWEAQVIQRRRETQQDTIAFANRLSHQLHYLMNVLDQNETAVTAGSRDRLRDLVTELGERQVELMDILRPALDELNAVHREHGVPEVYVP